MSDSVSLIRRKIEDPSQAFEAATMNAVVTLAAIEVIQFILTCRLLVSST